MFHVEHQVISTRGKQGSTWNTNRIAEFSNPVFYCKEVKNLVISNRDRKEKFNKTNKVKIIIEKRQIE